MTAQAGATVCEAFRPYRHLAVRVLARAFLDLADPARAPADRESARVFLAGSGLMRHWCRVAALDPGWISRRAALVRGISHDDRRFLFQMGDPHAVPRPHTIHNGVR